MRTKVLLGCAVVLMLVVSVVTIGSNMGFKISIPLTAGYSNYVSLPYYNSYADATAMFNDITGASVVSRWNNATPIWENWTGARGTNFAVTAGEAYVVQVSATTNWIVVGSHNPGLAVTMTVNYSNYISVPYHTTATNASTLFTQIPSASVISRWNNATPIWENWTGARGTNFALTVGEGYVAQVSATGTWPPAHY